MQPQAAHPGTGIPAGGHASRGARAGP
eukprot:SAG31_NODE_8714_length_1400_cov_2.177556_1_plen_26_part_10